MDTLDDLRQKIDAIDEQLLTLFAKRFALAKHVGEYKKIHSLSIIDKKREVEKIKTLKKIGEKNDVSLSFIKKAWKIVFAETYKIEGDIDSVSSTE